MFIKQKTPWILSLLLCGLWISSPSWAETLFSVPATRIDGQRAQVLMIRGADELSVTIGGQLAAGDVLRIYEFNATRQQTGHIVREFANNIPSDQATFSVLNDTIKVTFNSNGRSTRSSPLSVQVQAVSPRVRLNEIKKNLEDAIKQVHGYRAGEAYQLLERALEQMQGLQTELQQGTEQDYQIEVLRREFNVLNNIYSQIASLRADIEQRHKLAFDLVKGEVDKTERKSQENAEELKQLEQQMNRNLSASSNDPLELRKFEIQQRADQGRLNAMRIQGEIWNKAFQTQKLLEKPLREYSRRLLLLLFTLEANAQLYRSAEQVIAYDPMSARESLSNIEELERILAEMQSAWREVQVIRDSIQQISF